MKTIYNTFIEVESQEQADRLKQVCIDNELPIWIDEISFIHNEYGGNQFYYTIDPDRDGIVYAFTILYDSEYRDKVTESEWLELLKTTK